ncbi:MAG: trehalose-phosphatase [candidate division Zixibacteria bacterium]|nr:trehalose-phosphatase [candidate division Zixibacteria bacterium]
MKILNPAIDFDSFHNDINSSSNRILFLDYDGTLAPFKVHRDKAKPYPGVRKVLNSIIESERTQVVIISGRWTKELVPLLGLNRNPEIWGSHGWERLKPDGTYEIAKIDEQALKVLADADKITEDMGLEKRCEKKPACLALHWRDLDIKQISDIRKRVRETWSKLIFGTGLKIYNFDGGMEIRIPGRNKGDAVRTVLSESGKKTICAYLGDDLTDEDAFKAIKQRGLGVLVREKFRETTADLWLVPPEELLKFLKRWL